MAMNKKTMIAASVAASLAIVYILAKQHRAETVTPGEDDVRRTGQEQGAGRVHIGADDVKGGQFSTAVDSTRFSDLKAAANRGDAAAQRELAAIYDQCFQYNLNPQKFFLAPLSALEKQHPEFSPRIKAIRDRYSLLCSTVDSGAPIPSDAVGLWLAQSAKSGDVAAKVAMASRSPDALTDEEASQLLKSMQEKRNPAAVFNMGDAASVMASKLKDPETQSLLSGAHASYAWQVAACRSGYDCSANSAFMVNLCITSALCNYTSYESLVIDKVIPPGERRSFEESVVLIQENFLKKQ